MSTASHRKSLSRRQFLKTSGMAGTALLVGYYLPASAQGASILAFDKEPTEVQLNAWVRIGTDGKVTIFSHRAEMGQGSYQAVPQIVAEELEVDLAAIKVVFSPGDNKKYGSQVTGGSSTVRNAYQKLLKLGASAREMLIEAACKKWGVPNTECYAEAGHVIHRPSGRKYHYGELVLDASKLEPPKEVKLKPRSAYKLIGKPLRRLDTPLKTNGSAVFGLDKKIPGMLYAMVERNPRLRGVVKSFDDTATRKIPGVKHVFKVQMKVFNTIREGIAVVADSTWSALQGKNALKIEWDDRGFEHLNTEEIYTRHRENLKNEGRPFLSKNWQPRFHFEPG